MASSAGPFAAPAQTGAENRVDHQRRGPHLGTEIPVLLYPARAQHREIQRRIAAQFLRIADQNHPQTARIETDVQLARDRKTVAAVVSFAADDHDPLLAHGEKCPAMYSTTRCAAFSIRMMPGIPASIVARSTSPISRAVRTFLGLSTAGLVTPTPDHQDRSGTGSSGFTLCEMAGISPSGAAACSVSACCRICMAASGVSAK